MKLAALGFIVVLVLTAFTCSTEEPMIIICPDFCCQKVATVTDLGGLDGCSIGLELDGGEILIPERRVYIQAPKPEEDPAYYFDFVPGSKVCIAYREIELATACMAGQNVFLTCIRNVNLPTANN